MQERGGRASGVGTASTTNPGRGPVKIEIEERSYEGQWVFASGGGAGVVNTFSATPSTGLVAVSGKGSGSMLLRSSDGSPLNCTFEYSEMSSAGSGVCHDEDGRTLDMQITRKQTASQ